MKRADTGGTEFETVTGNETTAEFQMVAVYIDPASLGTITEGNATMWTVYRTGSTSYPLTIGLDVDDGTAVYGPNADFSKDWSLQDEGTTWLNTSITISSGASSRSAALKTWTESQSENQETAVTTLVSGSDYEARSTAKTATVTIKMNGT